MEKLPEKYENEAVTVKDYAEELQIVDNKSNLMAADNLVDIKLKISEIKGFFKESVSLAHQAHKEAKSIQDTALEGWVEAEKIIKEKIGEFDADKEDQAHQITIARKYKIEVEHPDMLPEAYMILKPNISLLESMVKDAKGKIFIPGIKITEQKIVKVKVKTKV